MNTRIKILILEHSPNDIGLIQEKFIKSDLNYSSEVVQTREEYVYALHSFHPDIIIADYSLLSLDGLSAFRIRQDVVPETPFIIVSGPIGEENAVELIRMGVTDFVLKERMCRLKPIIQRALQAASDREQRKVAERQRSLRAQQLQKIMDLSLDVICTLDQEGRYVTVSAAAKNVWGYRPVELIGRTGIDLVHGADKERTIQAIADLRTGKVKDMVNFENRYIRKDGTIATILWSVHLDPKENQIYAIARDANDIKKAEEKIRNNEKRFRALVQNSTDGFCLLDAEGTILERSQSAKKILGLETDAVPWKIRFDLIHGDDLPAVQAGWSQVRNNPGAIHTFAYRFQMPDGSYQWLETACHNQLQEPNIRALVVNFRDITTSKIAEIALKASEARLQEAQAIGHIGNWEMSFVNGTTVWSDEMYRIYGVAKSAIKPSFEAFVSFIHPDDRETVLYQVEKDKSAWQNFSVSFRILRGNGEIRYVYSERDIAFNDQGRPLRIFGILQDITERKLAEIALKTSEASLKQAQAFGHIGSWEMDGPDGRMLWSDEMYRLFGLGVEEVTPGFELFTSFIHPEDRPVVVARLEKARGALENDSISFRIVHRDGEVRYVSSDWQHEFDDKGRLIRVFGILQDFTERKLAEIAVEKSEEKYRNLFKLSPIPMWVYDVGTLHFLDVNVAAIKHYGYSKDEFLAMTLKDIRPKDKIRKLEEIASTLQGSRVHFHIITKHLKRSGEVIDVDINNSFVDLGGRETRLVIATDISERLKYVEAIKAQNVQLREIAWIQSHVVRAPLARMMGLINLLNNYPPENISTTDIISFLSISAHELDNIVRDIVKKAECILDQPILDAQPG